jgi:type II secretory pathway pseudopilin PulG
MSAQNPARAGVALDSRFTDARGFSLSELMLVVASIAIVSAMALPTITNMLPNMRVGMSARAVERTLQTARLKAVASNRAIRVRFNCPAVGQFRMVELIGTPGIPAAADGDGQAATRCSPAAYPHPDQAIGTFDIPNNDGPPQELQTRVEFVNVQTIEFRADGRAYVDAGTGNPWPAIPDNDPVEITLRRSDGGTAVQAATLHTIEVNSLGRIRIQ